MFTHGWITSRLLVEKSVHVRNNPWREDSSFTRSEDVIGIGFGSHHATTGKWRLPEVTPVSVSVSLKQSK